MGIFKKKNKASALKAKVLKDYGIISEYLKGIVKFRYRLLLIERGRKRKIIIEESSPLVGLQDRYFEFGKAGTEKLREALTDALRFL